MKSKAQKRNERKRRNDKKYALLSRTPYSLRTGVQTLGPGRTLSRVTLNYIFVPTENAHMGIFSVMQDAFETEEFERFTNEFTWFKVLGIKVIVPPRIDVSQSLLQNGRLAIDWTDNTTAEDLLADDGAKEFFAYSTRPVTFKFAPPNVTLRGQTGQYMNYCEWNSIDQLINAPGLFKVTSLFTIRFTVEVLVAFRGNQKQKETDPNIAILVKDKIKYKVKNLKELTQLLKVDKSEEIVEEDSGEEDFLKEEDKKEEKKEEKNVEEKEEKKEENKEVIGKVLKKKGKNYYFEHKPVKG
jgi:hypothetical protein